MQVSIISGVIASKVAEFEISTPINLEPIIVDSGVSKGMLRHTAGTKPFSNGPGPMRASILWNDRAFAIQGTSLVEIVASGAVAVIGDVGDGDAGLDYSFDRLIVRSGGRLYYYDGATLTQVTDADLGTAIDAMWIDGYTMTTDGRYVLVSELNDPFQFKTAKYGSAEDDPDPVTGLIRLRGEAYVLGANTIQVFQNVGGNGFPFAAAQGATIPIGCVSASAKCLFGQSFAFVGSARGDALGVYIAGSGSADKISTRAMDRALAAEMNPAGIVVERRVSDDELRLFVHLSRETWVFLAKASAAAGQSVWYRCRTGSRPYRMRHALYAFGKVLVGDVETGGIGELTADVATHFGEAAGWQFDAGLLYNNAKGAIVDTVELVGLPGRGDDATLFMSSTRDGQTFSPERAISGGDTGQRGKRMQWRPRIRMRTYLGLRFRGRDSALAGFAACEVGVRPLAV